MRSATIGRLIRVIVLVFLSTVAARAQTVGRIRPGPPAPLFLLPEPERQPLLLMAAGIDVEILGTEGSWLRVSVEDSQYGRRIGYVESRWVEARPQSPPATERPSVGAKPRTPVMPANPRATMALRPESGQQAGAGSPCVIVQVHSPDDVAKAFAKSLGFVNPRGYYQYVEGTLPNGIKIKPDYDASFPLDVQKKGGGIAVLPPYWTGEGARDADDLEAARKSCKQWQSTHPVKAAKKK